ncbi:MAG TPA: phytanoyl-CoA dioxygenase family protein [Usitatibacter sp.]|nr:phytanoyl-CoA dioxygenase family protein [Usitatibacter sp.]
MISPKDVAFYKEAGYVVQQEFFDRETIAELGRACDALCQKAKDLTRNDDLYDLEDSHTPQDVRVRRLKKPTEMDPVFHRIARHPKLLDALAALIGPAIRMSHPTGKINIKGAEYGAPVEWHQDWAAYPHTNDDLLSVGIPLDDCMDENGPLLVIPDTHRGPIYDHHVDGVYCGGIDAVTSGIDFSKAVALTGKAGMVTFHHARAVHGSALNRSKRSRRLLLLQYAAVDAWPILGVPSLDKFNAGIVRGEPTLEPRMVAVPIRIPLPMSPTTGSLYEQQRIMANRHFKRYDEVQEKVGG